MCKSPGVGKYHSMVYLEDGSFFFPELKLDLFWPGSMAALRGTQLMSLQEMLQLLVTHLLQGQGPGARLFASLNIMSMALQMLLLCDELTSEAHLAFHGDKSSACQGLIYSEWNNLFRSLGLSLWDSCYDWVPVISVSMAPPFLLPVAPIT